MNSTHEHFTGRAIRTSCRLAFFTLCVSACTVAKSVRADSWTSPVPGRIRSHNGIFVLALKPSGAMPTPPGFCLAELFRFDEGKSSVIWRRYLINDDSPVRTYVTDSGRYVVTMDEWGRVGTLPIVIYGRRGELIRVHDLATLGLDKDLEHIYCTVSSQWWNQHALVFFGPQEKTMIIRLHWGKLLVVRLRDGKLLEREDFEKAQWDSLRGFIDDASKKQVLSLARSENPTDRETAAVQAGQLQIKEAVPLLRALLDDKTVHEEGSPFVMKKVYPVREAAKAALEAMGEQSNVMTRASSQPAR